MNFLMRVLIPFLIYGFFGWLLMTILHTACTGRLVSAGFLTGPFCPSFGVTAVLLIQAAPVLFGRPLLIFIAGTALALAMDVAGAWIMLAMFRVQWWADKPGGLRLVTIRLVKAMAAGLLGSLLIYVMHPWVETLVASIPSKIAGFVVTVGTGVFLLDCLYSLDVLDKLILRVHRLHDALGRLHRLYGHQGAEDGRALPCDAERLHALKAAGGLEEDELAALAQVDALTAMWRPGYRLVLALPHMQPEGMANETALLRKEWLRHSCVDERWLRQAFVRIKARVTAGAAQDAAPFAKGIGFYKLLWVFVVACVLGFFIETVFALVSRGVLESRTGMVYGPFNQVYGLGAVLMVVLLQPLAKKNDRWLFLASALLGGVYEFVCSWTQELMFGTVSWDYTNNPTSIGGRTSLLLMLWWGVLGVVFIKGVYPKLSQLIERIPRRPGAILSWGIALFLVFDLSMSAVAVGRWVGRQHDYPAQTALDSYVDRHFPDDAMEAIYPSMKAGISRETASAQ